MQEPQSVEEREELAAMWAELFLQDGLEREERGGMDDNDDRVGPAHVPQDIACVLK